MTMAYPELSRIVTFITMGAKSFGFVRYPRLVKPCDACRLLHSFAEESFLLLGAFSELLS